MITVPAGRLVVGMQLPIQSQSRLFVQPWEEQAGAQDLASVARAADEAGFFYVAVCDHVAIPASLAPTMGTHWSDCLTTLGWLAGITRRVNLLSHVYVLPYRHPLMAAKQWATLDHLSGGRAIAGIGAGHVEAEFALLGVDHRRRGALLDEALPSFASALEQEYSGGFGQRPRPIQQPRPPIWIGGSSRAAIRRAAAFDGWLPQGPATLEAIAALTAERERLGLGDAPFATGHIVPPVHVGTPSWDVGPHTVAGGAEQVAERLLALTPAGVNQVQVRLASRSVSEQCDQVLAFGAEVLPLLDGN